MNPAKAGREYAIAVCTYIDRKYATRGIKLYREVPAGRSIIGKERRIDILALDESSHRALAIECKYQDRAGTVEKSIHYALEDLRAMRMPACLVYGGKGFSDGVVHTLRASGIGAYCQLGGDDSSNDTTELDYILAREFRWWDEVIRKSRPFLPDT